MLLRLLRLFSAEKKWETEENEVVEDAHGSDVL
jgi:hypothetical protein